MYRKAIPRPFSALGVHMVSIIAYIQLVISMHPPHCDDDIRHLQHEDEEQGYSNDYQEQAQLVASLVTPPIHCCAVGQEEA